MKKMNRILFGLVALLATQPAMASLTQRFSSYLPSFGAAKTTRPVSYPKPTGIGQGIFSKPTGTTFGQGTQTPFRSFFSGSKPLTPGFNSNKPSLMQPDLLRPQNLFEGQRRQYSQDNQGAQETIVVTNQGTSTTKIMLIVIGLFLAYQLYDKFGSPLVLDSIKTNLEFFVEHGEETMRADLKNMPPDKKHKLYNDTKELLETYYDGERSNLSKQDLLEIIRSARNFVDIYNAYNKMSHWLLTLTEQETYPGIIYSLKNTGKWLGEKAVGVIERIEKMQK